MSMSNGSPSEMPNLPRFSTRQLPDAACAEGLLVGRGVAPGAPVGQQALARMLAIAASPATDRELAQEVAHVTFGAPAPHHSVPVPLPIGGSSRQPGNNEIQATGQPGHQKAAVKGKQALPDTAQGHQKVHGRKAHPHGRPGHQEIHRASHPATHPGVSQGRPIGW